MSRVRACAVMIQPADRIIAADGVPGVGVGVIVASIIVNAVGDPRLDVIADIVAKIAPGVLPKGSGN